MRSTQVKPILFLFMLIYFSAIGQQEVPILNYTIDENGVAAIEVNSSEDNYYLLRVKHHPDGEFDWPTSFTFGEEGTTVISESLAAYPEEYYKVEEYSILTPGDFDNDGIDDVTEFNDMPFNAPINTGDYLTLHNGAAALESYERFNELALDDTVIPWAQFLSDKEFLKFVIEDIHSDSPKIYFVNSKTHETHSGFMNVLGISYFEDDVTTGEIIFHPVTVGPNGKLGVFSFNFSLSAPFPFETVRLTQELLATNMPFLENNLVYFLTPNNDSSYEDEKELFDESRIQVLHENQLFANIKYLALNVAEGYGTFRLMDNNEVPGSRDVVLYEYLPNTLPRVAGIMTSVIQTPLSHVNLRAIQDNVPNAYIMNPLEDSYLAGLLGKPVYYAVYTDGYFIREASTEELDEWFDSIRPTESQKPKLNLDYTSILPLDDIDFDMSDGFGAKCANVATMRTFDFPEGTIPNGFGVPFYFYHEFMLHNGFYEDIDALLADEEFNNNLDVKIEKLKDFRGKIKSAEMPAWMLQELEEMHDSFPEGSSVRCRSSTNNEDLPGFSGAGLYTSKTQHPEEGHISKSIKQVYASMWNFRAFDERDFYRIDHKLAAMGVLCHLNYSEEKANGVGVSLDPIYQTDDTYYLNTQLGEDLVTNPEANSIPEEILLNAITGNSNFVRYSNLVPFNTPIMDEEYLELMRKYLGHIHQEFEHLYGAENMSGFAMDIEYKITAEDQLIIKQARPWASFWSEQGPSDLDDTIENMYSVFPNPVDKILNVEGERQTLKLEIIDLYGRKYYEDTFDFKNSSESIPTSELTPGMYFLQGKTEAGEIYFIEKFFKQ